MFGVKYKKCSDIGKLTNNPLMWLTISGRHYFVYIGGEKDNKTRGYFTRWQIKSIHVKWSVSKYTWNLVSSVLWMLRVKSKSSSAEETFNENCVTVECSGEPPCSIRTGEVCGHVNWCWNTITWNSVENKFLSTMGDPLAS